MKYYLSDGINVMCASGDGDARIYHSGSLRVCKESYKRWRCQPFYHLWTARILLRALNKGQRSENGDIDLRGLKINEILLDIS